MVAGLADLLNRVLSEYTEAKRNPMKGHPLVNERAEMEAAIQGLPEVASRKTLRAKLSFGVGNWARVPWMSFLDERETKSTQEGVYPVYLFREDLGAVYLTFNQGVTKIRKAYGAGNRLRDVLRARKEVLRPYCKGLEARGFEEDDEIDLGVEGGLGQEYQQATVAYKRYVRGQLPSEEELREDLEAVLTAYDQFLNKRPLLPGDEDAREPQATLVAPGGLTEGPHWDALQIGLSCQPFVLLAGPTGTGKTQAALALNQENTAWALVDVPGGWVDSASAFGYLNPVNGHFTPGPVLVALLDILGQDGRPILVLDEINVSPPHIYLAPLLAALERAHANESPEPLVVLQVGSESAKVVHEAAKTHAGLRVQEAGPFTQLVLDIPGDLRVVGTLNFDGSTEDLAPKLLSRSFVVWFEAPDVREDLTLVPRTTYGKSTTGLGSALQMLQSQGVPVSPRVVVRAKKALEQHGDTPGIVDMLLAGLVLPQVQTLTEEQQDAIQDAALLDALPDGFFQRKFAALLRQAREEGYASLWLVA